MDFESLKWFATLGVGGTLAAGMFLFYRRDSLVLQQLLATNAEVYRSQQEILVTIAKENVAAMTRNTAAVEANTQTVAAMHTYFSVPRDPSVRRQADR